MSWSLAGGAAGVIAAIQAARLGRGTVVLEMTGQLGGTMTNGGVSAPAHFFNRGPAGDRRHRLGAGHEDEGAGWIPLPDFNNPPPNRPSHHVSVNPYLYACLAERAAWRAGVTLHYHEVVTTAEARATAGWWRALAEGYAGGAGTRGD